MSALKIEEKTTAEMPGARRADADGRAPAGQEPAEHQNACRKHRAETVRHARERIAQALWSFFIAHPPEDAVFLWVHFSISKIGSFVNHCGKKEQPHRNKQGCNAME